MQDCEIDNKTLESAGRVYAVGFRADLQDSAQGEVLDDTIVENTADSTDVIVSGVEFEIRDSSTPNVERTAIGLNAATGGDVAPQLWSTGAGLITEDE